MIPSEEIENRFRYHPADTDKKKNDHEYIRGRCKELAYALNEVIPDGEEKKTALKKLEEVMFWSNAGIARR